MSTEVVPAAQPAPPATTTSEPGPYHSATHKGIVVTSNTGTEEEMQASLAFDKDAEANVDQDPASPQKLDKKAEAKPPAKTEAPSGPERGPDGRWLPKEGKAAAPAEEAEPEETPEQAKERKGNPRHDPVARMQEVTREAAALKRDLQIARQELQAARATPRPQPASAPQALPAPGADAPKEEDFSTYADFVDARATYRANQAIEQRLTRMAQEAQGRERATQYTKGVETAVSRMQQKAEELRAANSDEHASLMDFAAQFQPGITLPQGVRPGPMNALGDEIMASPEPVGVLRYLHDHPDTLQRIATLRTSREVAREVAKIEARIEAQSQAEAAAPAGTAPKPVSQAPRPVRPVTGGRIGTDSSEPDDSMTDTEYFRRRMAQGIKKGRR